MSSAWESGCDVMGQPWYRETSQACSSDSHVIGTLCKLCLCDWVSSHINMIIWNYLSVVLIHNIYFHLLSKVMKRMHMLVLSPSPWSTPTYMEKKNKYRMVANEINVAKC